MMMDTRSTRARLAIAAVVLGALAMVAGSPYVSRHATMDIDALSNAVLREDDHVTALELGEWIRARREGLRVFDVRDSAAFDEFHIPTAERVSVEELARLPLRRTDTIVLYSEGGPHAAQGWVFLRALGYPNVYFLKGGLYEWVTDVMNPTIPATATDSARKAFQVQAELSRYFGGLPRVGAPSAIPGEAIPLPRKGEPSGEGAATSAAVKKLKKRSC